MEDNKVMINDGVLTAKDINEAYSRWYWFAEGAISYERYQAIGYCYALSKILRKLYKNADDLKAALKRHLAFFNTEAIFGSPILGLTVAMEEDIAKTDDVEDKEALAASINGMKTGLMGPLAGIGDTIDWGTLKPIIYGIACTLGASGNVLGAIIPFAFVFILYYLGKWMWNLGYKSGRGAISNLLSGGFINEIIDGTGMLGLFMMGALTSGYVSLSTPVAFSMGEMTITLQSIFDGIVPGLLPLAVVLGLYFLMKKKTQRYSLIVLGIIAVCVLGALIGIF